MCRQILWGLVRLPHSHTRLLLDLLGQRDLFCPRAPTVGAGIIVARKGY
jgi:hypothetical protein